MKNFLAKFNKSEACAAILLLAILLTVFWPEANKEFLLWDDEAVISQYKPFLPITWSTVFEEATSTYLGQYIPTSRAIWMLTILPMQWLYGSRWSTENWVQPFILVGIFFHFFNCLLIKEILTSLFKKPTDQKNWKDWIPVFLYALHPLQVEALAAVSIFRETAWVFFGLLSIRSYLNNRLKLSFVLFFLACLAKPTAIVIAGLLLLLQLIKKGRDAFQDRRISIYFSALFSLVIPLAIIAKKIQPTQDFATSQLDRIIYISDTLGFYLVKILLPLNLTIDYGRTHVWLIQQGWTIEMSTFAIFIISLLILYWKKKQSRNNIILLTAILILPLLPVSGVVAHSMQTYSNVTDHYATFSIIALSGLVYLLIKSYYRIYLALIPLCIFYGWQSFQQKKTWVNNETLAAQILEVNPRSFLAYNNLGLHWLRMGKEQPALEAFGKSIELNPKIYNAYLNSFYILSKRELYNEAATLLEEGKKNIPRNADIRLSLALALEKQNKLSEAIKTCNDAAQDFPDNAKIRHKLGLLYWKQDQFEQAINEFEKAHHLEIENQKYSEILKKSEALLEEIKKVKK